jgi:hypothetical protein
VEDLRYISLEQEIYRKCTDLWFKNENRYNPCGRSRGHPGLPGWSEDGKEKWNIQDAYLLGAKKAIEEVLAMRNGNVKSNNSHPN